MNKTHSSADRAILLLLTLLCAIPFCLRLSEAIQAAVYAEAMAAFISLLLIGIISITVKQGWSLNKTTGWLFAFSCVIGLQMLIMPSSFIFVRLWPLLALILTAFLILTLNCWKQSHQINNDEIFESISFGILLGGVANALYALIQIGISILDDNNLEIFGFLGQRNNYGDYLALSIAALCWLYSQKKIITALFYSILTLLSVAITLSASRSVLLYIGVMLIIGIIAITNKTLKSNNHRFGKILLLAVAIQLFAQILTPYLISQISLSIGSKKSAQFYGSLSSLNRVVDDGYSSEKYTRLRPVESMKALVIFSQNPVLGTGWDSYRKESSALQRDSRFIAYIKSDGFFSHSHNLITQIMAETGGIGFIIILGGCTWLIFGLRKNNSASNPLATYTLLGIMLSHSMFEFPLWHFQFFILFCLILWNGQPTSQIINKPSQNLPLRIIMLVFFTAGLALLLKGAQWYLLIEENQRPSWTHKISRDHVLNLTPYQKNPFLDLPATQALIAHHNQFVPVEQITKLLNQYNQYQYLSIFMYKEAILQSKIGNMERAKELIKLTLSSYPNTVSAIESQIRELPQQQQKILCAEINTIIEQMTAQVRTQYSDVEHIEAIFGEKYRNAKTRCPR